MIDMLDIQDKLQDTAAAIARLHGEMSRHPQANSLRWDLKSLEKRRERLEADLLAAAAAQGRDVCSYRLIPEAEKVRLGGVVGVLSGYQSLITVFYDAIKSRRPKRKASVSADAAEETALDWGYAF